MSLKLALLKAAAQQNKELEGKLTTKINPKTYISENLNDVIMCGGVAVYKGVRFSVHVNDGSNQPIKNELPVYKYHFKAATGNTIYIKCSKRDKAQAFVDEVFGTLNGKHKYHVCGY